MCNYEGQRRSLIGTLIIDHLYIFNIPIRYKGETHHLFIVGVSNLNISLIEESLPWGKIHSQQGLQNHKFVIYWPIG